MSTFVALGEEDVAIELIHALHHAKHGKDESKAKESSERKEDAPFHALIAADKHVELLDQLVFQQSAVILKAEEQTFDSIITLTFAMLNKIPDAKFNATIEKLQTLIETDIQTYPITKIKLLTTLFNMLDDPSPRRISLFRSILQSCLSTNHHRLVIEQIKNLSTFISLWNLNPVETAPFYLLASQLAKAAGQSADAESYLQKHLRALDTASNDIITATKPVAAQAALTAIQGSTIIQADAWLSLRTIAALENDATYGPLHRLLHIFAYETVEPYLTFASQHQSWLTSNQLIHEDLLMKLRTLTLCSLGEQKQKLTYQDVKQALQLPDLDSVENSVIDAVVSGRVDARLDQEKQIVVIKRTSFRAFTNDSWSKLAEKLNVWKSNVHNTLATLHQAQAQAQPGAAPIDDDM